MNKVFTNNNVPVLSYGGMKKREAMSFRRPLQIVVAGILTALAGCQTTNKLEPASPVSYTQRHPIQVTNDQVSMQVRAGKNRSGLTRAQRARVGSFVAGYKNTGTGSLRIKAPSSQVNDVQAAGAVAEVRRIMERNAIPRSNIRMVNYYPRNRRVSAPVILSYQRNAALASNCETWPEPSTLTYKNQPYWNFGCATQNNLAAMVANPRDLVQPRRSSPADAQRRDVVIDKYRTGEVTTAKRDESETGTVSDVADK